MKIIQQNKDKLTKYPLLALLISQTDTPKIINKAFEISDSHPFYIGDNTPASMATFLTEKEAKGRPDTAPPAIRITTGGEYISIYETNRFRLSLRQAREQFKESVIS